MAFLASRGDDEATIHPYLAKPHAGEPALAPIVHQAGRTPSRTAQVQPMQRRAAARFQVRLIPHKDKIRQMPIKSKPG